MATVQNLNNLMRKLERLAAEAKRQDANVVVVGYTAGYALSVHENLQAYHSNGQAKFLEQPAREMQKELGRVVAEAVKNGSTIEQSLLLAGLRLQRASQKLCPVDTGNLKNSAYTRLEIK